MRAPEWPVRAQSRYPPYTPNQTHNTQYSMLYRQFHLVVLYPRVHGNEIEKERKKVGRHGEVNIKGSETEMPRKAHIE
jgi:hypothetical protein